MWVVTSYVEFHSTKMFVPAQIEAVISGEFCSVP